MDFSTSASETSENLILFVFISSFSFLFGVCICVQYFFDKLRNQTSNRKYVLELIIKIRVSSIKWSVLAHFLTPNFTPKNLTYDNRIFFFNFFSMLSPKILTPNTHA